MSLVSMFRSCLEHSFGALAPREAADRVAEQEAQPLRKVIDVADQWFKGAISAPTRQAADLAQQASIEAFKQSRIFEVSMSSGGGIFGLVFGGDSVAQLVKGERDAMSAILKTVEGDASPRGQQVKAIATETLAAMDAVDARPAKNDGLGGLFGALNDARSYHEAAMSALTRIGRLGGVDVEAGLAPLRVQAAAADRAYAAKVAERKVISQQPVNTVAGAVRKAEALRQLGETQEARQAVLDAPVHSGADLATFATAVHDALSSSDERVAALTKRLDLVKTGDDAAALVVGLAKGNYFSDDKVAVLGKAALNLGSGVELGKLAKALRENNTYSDDLVKILKPAVAKLSSAEDVAALERALKDAGVYSSDQTAILGDVVKALPASARRVDLVRDLGLGRAAELDVPVRDGMELAAYAKDLQTTVFGSSARIAALTQRAGFVTRGEDAGALAKTMAASAYSSAEMTAVLGKVALGLRSGTELGKLAKALGEGCVSSASTLAILKPAAEQLRTSADIAALGKAMGEAGTSSSVQQGVLRQAVQALPATIDRKKLVTEFMQAGMFGSLARTLVA